MDEKIEIPMAFWRDIKNALNQYVEEEGGKDGEFAEASYHKLLSYGASPQEARNVLPLSLKTELIMTGTYSNWTDMLKLRMDEAAHPQMRYLMQLMVALPDFPRDKIEVPNAKQ